MTSSQLAEAPSSPALTVIVDRHLDPLCAALLPKLLDAAAAAGWQSLVYPVRRDGNVNSATRAFVDRYAPAAVIYLTTDPSGLDGPDLGVPTLALGVGPVPEAPNLSTVRSDDAAGARTAAQVTLELGHRRFGVLAGPGAGAPTIRSAAFAATLAAAGTQFDPERHLIRALHGRGGGYRGMAQLIDLDPHMTAVLCTCDCLALGAMRALADAHVEVPQAVSVVGFDGLEAGDFSIPRLSSVAHDFDSLISSALETLALLLTCPDEPTHVLVPMTLCEGESLRTVNAFPPPLAP